MKRGTTLAAVTVAVAAGAAGGGWAYGYGPLARHVAAGSASPVPVSTAVVRRGTLSVTEQDQGTISYADPLTVYSAAAGTVTWLPPAGAVIGRGQRLYAVDGQDAFAMHGATPAWRAFSPGMSDGTDVAELQRNLIALGYDPYRFIMVDGCYDWATQAAVERWQEALGETVSAVIPLGQVAFVPGTARVSIPQAGVGAAVASGTPLLTITSTTPVVTIALPAAEQAIVRAGERVSITLPDGSTTGGIIKQVGSRGGTGGAGSSGSSGSSGASGASGASGSTGQQTVDVTASLGRPVAGLDGASVQVTITTQVQRAALIVPISALLADPGGNYQVTVVSGGARRNVPVLPGPFDDLDGTVAITGQGMTAGTRVEVPALS
jgi:peptidoglycan hydrolase-like protein with peptidoglycan-binding domain